MKKILFITFFIMIIFSTTVLHAESSTFWGSEGAVYIDDNKGYGITSGFDPISYTPLSAPTGYLYAAGDKGRILGSGWGAVKALAYIRHDIKVPFMQGTEALTSGNNILYSFKGTFSPVSLQAITTATFTPLAFLNMQAGSSIGAGWNAGFSNGLGLNIDGTGTASEDSLKGIVFESWFSGTFQFDLGALIPGKWTHILLAVTSKLAYKHYSAASADEPWLFQADAGENFNGFSYFGTYILGYKLPYKADTIAFLIETEQMLFNNSNRSPMDSIAGWGSDFVKTTFGPLVNIQLSDTSSIIILIQFAREKSFTDNTIFNNYFINRDYNGSYIDLQRIAFSYTMEIK
jgi:hypothetical protein